MRKAFGSVIKSITCSSSTGGEGSEDSQRCLEQEAEWQRDFLKTAKSGFDEKYRDHSSCPGTDFKKFEVTGILGRGRFAIVLHAANREQENSSYAIKVLNKEKCAQDRRVQAVIQEKKIWYAVNCDFIIKLHSVAKDHTNIYFIMEHAPGGDLSQLEDRREKIVRHFAAQVVLALEYLHTCDVLYRNLEPSNILLFPNARVKLGDFGCAVRMDSRLVYGVCGCPEYLAPEVLRNQGYRDPSDWWSFGVLLYDLLLKKLPYEEVPRMEPVPLKFPKSSRLSVDAKDLILKLVEFDAAVRLGRVADGASSVRSHPWFKALNFFGVLQGKTEIKLKDSNHKRHRELIGEDWAKIFPNVGADLHKKEFVEF